MSTWRIVSAFPYDRWKTQLKIYQLDVSRPDPLSSADIASIVQAAGLQGMSYSKNFHSHLTPLAVRKNRYVILPIDFEEAWKVGCLFGSFRNITQRFFSLTPTSKRSRGQMILTSSVRTPSLYYCLCLILSLSRLDR